MMKNVILKPKCVFVLVVLTTWFSATCGQQAPLTAVGQVLRQGPVGQVLTQSPTGQIVMQPLTTLVRGGVMGTQMVAGVVQNSVVQSNGMVLNTVSLVLNLNGLVFELFFSKLFTFKNMKI